MHKSVILHGLCCWLLVRARPNCPIPHSAVINKLPILKMFMFPCLPVNSEWCSARIFVLSRKYAPNHFVMLGCLDAGCHIGWGRYRLLSALLYYLRSLYILVIITSSPSLDWPKVIRLDAPVLSIWMAKSNDRTISTYLIFSIYGNLVGFFFLRKIHYKLYFGIKSLLGFLSFP